MKWLRWFSPKASISTSQQLLTELDKQNKSRAGVFVTPMSAMQYPAVAAAVSTIAEGEAQLPFPIYKRLDGGGKVRDRSHPAWQLLNVRANPWQSAFAWREMSTMHLALWGNCYSFKLKVRGQVRELLPIHPDRVTVEQTADYRIVYTIALPDGSSIAQSQETIFHVMDRSLNGYVGLSRVTTGREAIGLGIRLEQYSGQLFGNGARPSGILSTDKPLTEKQINLIRESWNTAHGGENALGTAVLDHGMKFDAMGMKSVDAQFLENRAFQIAEVSRVWKVPPHMLGDLSRSTNNNIEYQGGEFVRYTLMPWLRRWETAVHLQLLDASETHFAEHLVDGLLRGDIKSRYDAYAIGKQNGWLNANEIREIENMNPREGGDEYREAANIFGNPPQEAP